MDGLLLVFSALKQVNLGRQYHVFILVTVDFTVGGSSAYIRLLFPA